MPEHLHTITALSETERVLVQWLMQEINAIRTELGMPEVTQAGLDELRRTERTRQRQHAAQEGRAE